MMEDRELNSWLEQWGTITLPGPDLQQIQRKIKRQQRRFLLDNVLAAASVLGGLAFAFVLRDESGRFGRGWATGVCILMFVLVGTRLWFQRGAWRAESQSTLDFVELWHKRVAARIRLLRLFNFIAPAWLVVCAILATLNWETIGPEFHAQPVQWLLPLGISILVLPFMFLWAAWLRRRKLAELVEIDKILTAISEQ